jgi:thiol-disulfide isomerase/thioredoxin
MTLKIYKLIVPLFLLAVLECNAQKDRLILSGTATLDSGEVYLMPLNAEYYPLMTTAYDIKAIILNGKFNFNHAIQYPSYYYLGIKSKGKLIYLSDQFMVEKGIQTIHCNIDSLREMPLIDNPSMTELRQFKQKLLPLEQALDQVYATRNKLKNDFEGVILDSLLSQNNNDRKTIEDQKRIFLYDYVKSNPNSYISLWELIKKTDQGYEPIYEDIYSLLSKSIKSIFAGKVLSKKLRASKNTSLGTQLPLFAIFDTNNKRIDLPAIYAKNKFTLIDLWHTHCSGCIAQFPELLKIHSQYHQKGFEIIGISVDKKEEIEKWKQMIIAKQILWIQGIDANGLQALKLSINYFQHECHIKLR